MAYRKKTYRKKRTFRKKGGIVKRAVRKAKKQIFAKRVKTVVNRMSETKNINYFINNFIGTSVLSAGFGNTIKCLLPTGNTGGVLLLNQGTGQGNREGNKVSTVRMMLKGVIHINTAYDATFNYNMCPLYIAMYVFKVKGSIPDTVGDVTTVVNNTFFQDGNASSGFSGTLRDLTREVNSQQVMLLKKRVFKVGTSNVVSAFGVASANNANQQFGDSTVGISKMFRMDLTKCIPKTIQYNDTTSTPVNRQTYFMWVPFRVDGQLIATSLGAYTGTQPFYVDYSVDYMYKDL